MKGYNIHYPCSTIDYDVESEEIPQTAKMLGSAIADGRYNGVCDGAAGLLRGQYDNDSSMAVDPLCDFSTDKFTLTQVPNIPDSSSTSD